MTLIFYDIFCDFDHSSHNSQKHIVKYLNFKNKFIEYQIIGS